MLRKTGIVLVLMMLVGGLLQADFSYVETTKVTGGSLLKMMRFVPGGTKSLTEPTENAVYLKGNRMANVNKKTADIVDLDKETITHVDFEKKTYSVITFAEMAQLMAEMQKVTQQRMAEAQAAQKKGARPEDPQAKMDMKVDVKETGAARNVNGLDTKEFIMTIEMLISSEAQAQQGQGPMGMATKIVSDMWMTPQLPGYEEVQEFQKKVALKLATNAAPSMAPMMLQQRGSSELFKKMAEEGSKLKGTPVLTVTKMMGPGGMGGPGGAGGSSPEGPDMSRAGEAAQREAAREAQSEAARQSAMATGGRLGGLAGATAGGMLGGFGKKKPQPPKEQAPPPSQPQAQAQPAQLTESVMLETTSEKSGFAKGAVPAEKLAVPSGFTQVEPEMKKSLEQMKKGQ